MFTDLFKMFSAIVPNIGLLALILTPCVVVLSVSRDALEVDTQPRTAITPLGVTHSYIGWRYMCDNAEDCRSRLSTFIIAFRVLINVMLVAILSFFVADAALSALSVDAFPVVPLHRFGIWWVANVRILDWLGDGMQLAVVIAGPLIIRYLSEMVYLILRARMDAAR